MTSDETRALLDAATTAVQLERFIPFDVIEEFLRPSPRSHPDQFDHVATWDPREEWMDLGLRSRVDQRVRVDALALNVRLCCG